MTPRPVLLAFLILVAVLAIYGSVRTQREVDCAPAEPTADRHMHDPARSSGRAVVERALRSAVANQCEKAS